MHTEFSYSFENIPASVVWLVAYLIVYFVVAICVDGENSVQSKFFVFIATESIDYASRPCMYVTKRS